MNLLNTNNCTKVAYNQLVEGGFILMWAKWAVT